MVSRFRRSQPEQNTTVVLIGMNQQIGEVILFGRGREWLTLKTVNVLVDLVSMRREKLDDNRVALGNGDKVGRDRSQ